MHEIKCIRCKEYIKRREIISDSALKQVFVIKEPRFKDEEENMLK